jgi:hypothetical protein
MALASVQADDYSGSTQLHCDLCDTINIMVYSFPSNGTALWHIFKVSDVPKLRAFLQAVFKCDPRSDDPIHSQQYYLGPLLLKRLGTECGIVPFIIYQRVGEAVFIPAGCPHQVCSVLHAFSFTIILLFKVRSATRPTVSRLPLIS